MGVILAKFRRKKTTFEILEALENDIREIEDYKNNTELQHKKVVGRLILYSIGGYAILAALFYFFLFPANLHEQLLYIAPLLCFPFIIIFVKKLLTWHFNRSISQKKDKLYQMKAEKRKILENVIETERYKVAKEILEKFAPDQLRNTSKSESMISASTPQKTGSFSNANVVNKTLTLTPFKYASPLATRSPMLAAVNSRPMTLTPAATPVNRNVRLQYNERGNEVCRGTPPPLPLPQPILPRERTALDKMIDFIVGDGPNNRYALICSKCCGHNGMATREEFEYIAYRCCFCYTFNPAKKLKPSAPKIEDNSSARLALKGRDGVDSSTSDSEKNSPSDSENDEIQSKIVSSDPQREQTSANEDSPLDKKND